VKLKLLLTAAMLIAWPEILRAAEPVSVMIVGDFHMSGSHDLHNRQIDDMLAPKRQAEIAAITDALTRFKPTAVAAEWDADVAAQRYEAYLKGTLAPSHNEVVQLGFRLAKTAGLDKFYGIDADGDFPYDPIVAYAKAHGQTALLDAANADIELNVKREDALLASGRVTDVLRFLNDPASIDGEHDGFYRTMLKVGGGADQPGAGLLTAWYGRNFLICAQLVQLAKPGDRVVVFFGSGHAFLLRQCVTEMPGYRLVEANDYLPK
jgi:hypothetical protein